MTTLLNPPLAVGSTVQRAGFFTKRHTIWPVLRCQVFRHPDPNPIPQWQLTSPMEFQVSTFYAGFT